jgi:hypothetical protein
MSLACLLYSLNKIGYLNASGRFVWFLIDVRELFLDTGDCTTEAAVKGAVKLFFCA